MNLRLLYGNKTKKNPYPPRTGVDVFELLIGQVQLRWGGLQAKGPKERTQGGGYPLEGETVYGTWCELL